MITMPKAQSTRPPAPRPELLAALRIDKRGPLMLDVASIDPPAEPLRDNIDQAELESLAESVTSVTLLAPITVTPINEPGEQRYEVVCGDRRYRAAKLANWRKISAYVVQAPPSVLLEIAATENLQRSDLNPVEKARAIERLLNAGKSREDVAKLIGRNISMVGMYVQFLRLPDAWLQRVATGELSISKAQALSTYHQRPDVLAAVELDLHANPNDWAREADFKERLRILAERFDALPKGHGATPPPADGLPLLQVDRAGNAFAFVRRTKHEFGKAGTPEAEQKYRELVANLASTDSVPVVRRSVPVLHAPPTQSAARARPTPDDAPELPEDPRLAALITGERDPLADFAGDPLDGIRWLLQRLTTFAQIERVERLLDARKAAVARG